MAELVDPLTSLGRQTTMLVAHKEMIGRWLYQIQSISWEGRLVCWVFFCRVIIICSIAGTLVSSSAGVDRQPSLSLLQLG